MPERPWLDLLAERYRVIAPSHPGWGNSPLIDGIGLGRRSRLSLSRPRRRAGLAGCGPGRRLLWRLGRGRDHGAVDRALLPPRSGRSARRQIRRPSRSATSPTCTRCTREEYLRLAWADPAKGDTDFTQLAESELAAIVRGREAFALYGWKPYMHNPRLKRWLHRIDRPTLLLWGAKTGSSPPLMASAGLTRSRVPARSDPRRRAFPALGTARSLCRQARCLRRRQSVTGERYARLVFLGNGLSPGLGGRAEARLAARGIPEQQLRSARSATAY